MNEDSGFGRYILTFDEGTTHCKASVWNDQGIMISLVKKPLTLSHPQSGWSEADPDGLWKLQIEAAKEAIERGGIRNEQIAAIGVANQRETTIVWDEWGRPVYPAIIWQDRRASELIKGITDSDSQDLRQITGLIPDPYFSATKIKWILDHLISEGKHKGRFFAGTVDSWLVYKLTSGKYHVTDYSNASRTMLLDLRRGEWSADALEIFGIDPDLLPDVIDSQGGQIVTSKEIFGKEIPILAVIGDQQASLYGHLSIKKGEMKNTYGTGSFFLQNSGTELEKRGRLINSIAWRIEGNPITYSTEGSAFNTGSIVDWNKKNLGTEYNPRYLLEERASSQQLYFVPAFNGLGAPYWESAARGSIFGMNETTTRSEILKSTLESIAFRVRDIIEELTRNGGNVNDSLPVDGGLTGNDYLMQFQSDILGVEIVKSTNDEATSAGAAYMAGIASGMWDYSFLKSTVQIGKTYSPRIEKEYSDKLYEGWIRAVKSTIGYYGARDS